MESEIKYYQESKNISLKGLVISYGAYLLLALVFAYFYAVFSTFMPDVYIGFFITVGLGLLLGISIRFIVRIGSNRNKKSQLIQAFIFGLLTNYFQWVFYLLYVFNNAVPKPYEYLANLHWILMPNSFFSAIAEINHYGAWSIFGIQMNGLQLTIIWIIEALIIIVLPMVAIFKTKVYPYSEYLGKWYQKFTIDIDYRSISSIALFSKELYDDAYAAIEGLDFGDGYRHSKIHIFYLKDEDTQYITCENIFIEGRGRGKVHPTIVINNLAIEKQMADTILKNIKHDKES